MGEGKKASNDSSKKFKKSENEPDETTAARKAASKTSKGQGDWDEPLCPPNGERSWWPAVSAKAASKTSENEPDRTTASGQAEERKSLDLAPETSNLVPKFSELNKYPPVYGTLVQIPWSTYCTITQSPAYEAILLRVRKGEKLLELGCGLGQNLRKLFEEGANPQNLFGYDMDPNIRKAGQGLFADKEGPIKIIIADMIVGDFELMPLKEQFHMIYSSMFFHLFELTEQREIAKRVLEFLRPEQGSMLCGQQIGHISPGLYSVGRDGKKGYAHNVSSFRDMWGMVSNITGPSWHVLVDMDVDETIAAFLTDKDARSLRFLIRREPE